MLLKMVQVVLKRVQHCISCVHHIACLLGFQRVQLERGKNFFQLVSNCDNADARSLPAIFIERLLK